MTCVACGAQLPEDARFCPACGAAVEATSAAAAEERKLATVLFADLVGSTALADREDPERVRATLDRFYDAMTDEIVRTGGTVERFAGDSVMAAFGAPAALEDHAERALHAALAMQRRLTETFGDQLELRIGVNTGEVVVGAAREGTSFVTGDAVNVGARLEQAAAPGEVLAGERTVAAVRGAFEFGDQRVVEAKGKPDGLACRPVHRALTLMRPRGAGAFGLVFVGRESELDLLRATYRRAVSQNEPHLVTILGEPGVGKTRLVRELWDILSDQDPVPLRRTGRCLAYGDAITYWALGEIVKEQFGIVDGDPPEKIRDRLRGHEILGLVLGLDVAEGLHPLDARERLHEAVVTLVEEVAAERPLVLLVEDVHWAEDDLLDVLERVLREARRPLLLLATARPELLGRRTDWGAGRRNTASIWLEPLPQQSTEQMLDGMLSIELPAAIEELVVDKAGGNPFFVEELVGELVEAGVLVRHDGAWRSAELPEGFSVPDSVHAVLAARIDRLPPTEKTALQAASVVGRAFWPGAVVHLLEGAVPSFDVLEDRDFIRVRAGSSLAGEREYAFKHALTREVAYSSIPKARRGRLHAALADWMNAADRATDEYASLVAYHYAEAARPEDADLVWGGDEKELARLRAEAFAWLERAADLAVGRYEMLEAIELFRRAIALGPEPGDQVRIWRKIGMAGALRYDAEEVVEGFQRAIALTDEPGELAELYSQLGFQTAVRSGMFKRRPPHDLVHGWIDRAVELSSPHGVQRARALAARALHESSVGYESALEASHLADDLGDPELRSWAWAALAACAFHQRRFREAREWAERRFEVIDELGDPDHAAEAYETLIPAVETLAQFDEARRLATAHLERARALSPHHRMHSAALMVEVEELSANWSEIVRMTPLVQRSAEENAATSCIRGPRSLLLCALAAECLGDPGRAGELERAALAHEHEDYGFSLAHPLTRLALIRGDRDVLEDLLQEQEFHRYSFGPGTLATMLDARALLRHRAKIETEAQTLAEEGTYTRPFALRALAIVREDEALLEQAHEELMAFGLHWHVAQTERLLAGRQLT
jgi:class 3 adenylate cyclase/tetratricopeptide (TPR) repeat protein